MAQAQLWFAVVNCMSRNTRKGRRTNAAIEVTLKGTQVDRCLETGLPLTVDDKKLIYPCWAEFIADRARELTKRPVADDRVLELRGTFYANQIPNYSPTSLQFLYDAGLHRFWFEIDDGLFTFAQVEVQALGTSHLPNVHRKLGIPFVIRGRGTFENVTIEGLPAEVKDIFQ